MYEGFADDLSVAATADSIAQRDSAGRLKTATPANPEDAVNKGFLGSAATKDVGTSAGNVMEVGAFGLGSVVIENFTDFNDIDVTSFIGGNDGIANAPPWADSRVMGGLHIDKGGRSLQIMPSRFGDLGFRTSFDNVYRDWQELYHSGNSINPLDHGLGITDRTDHPSDDIDDNDTPSGTYRTDSDTLGIFPSGLSKFGTITVSRLNTTQAGQLYLDATGQTASRFYNNAIDDWDDWRINYHSGNTNFNEFGGESSNETIAHGTALNNNNVIFMSLLIVILPLQEYRSQVLLE